MAALAQAYRAFSSEPLPRRLDGAPTRNTLAILAGLNSAPLRYLPAATIGPYSGWAMTTVGDANAYRHFLPRILEVAVEQPEWMGTEPAVIAARANLAAWRDWPQAQRSALVEVFLAAFQVALCSELEAPADPASWLCGLAILDQPIAAPLQLWRSNGGVPAALRLADFAMSWETALSEGDSAPPFWQDAPMDIQAVVRAWVLSSDSKRQLQAVRLIAELGERWRIDQALQAMKRH